MLIFKNCRVDLHTGEACCEVEEYDGPVVYAGGGGGSDTVTSQVVPTGPYAPQIPFIMQLFQQANDLYRQDPTQFFPGQGTTGQADPVGRLTAAPNENLTASQGGIGDLAGGNIDQNQLIQQVLQTLGGGQTPGSDLGQTLTPQITEGIDTQLGADQNALSQFAGGLTDPASAALAGVLQRDPNQISAPGTQAGGTDVIPALDQLLAGGGGQNPFLDQLVQGAIQSTVDAFTRSVLPSIRSEAGLAGQPGGTRQGVAEGIATNDLNTTIGNTASSIYGNAFNTQANLQGQAAGQVIGAQQGDQSAGLAAGGLNNQLLSLILQGTGQVGDALGTGADIGIRGVGTGTAQAADVFQGGNALQLQQILGALGLIPGYQGASLAQTGAQNNLGLQQLGIDQNNIDALMNEFFFNQNAPFSDLSQFQQFVTGPYGATTGDAANRAVTLPAPPSTQLTDPRAAPAGVAPPPQQQQIQQIPPVQQV